MLLAEIHRRGFEIPPLLLAPWVDKCIFRPDWLHAADLGVSPRFLGNLFWHAIADRTHHYLRGANQKERSLDLWRRWIQPFYVETDCKDRLGAFGQTTVKQDKKGPNLGGTASCVKALVPFGRKFAEHMLSVHSSPTTRAMCAAAQHLDRAYQALSSKTAFAIELMQSEGQKFCLQYAALHAIYGDGKFWKLTPKFHISFALAGRRIAASAVLELPRRGVWWHGGAAWQE